MDRPKVYIAGPYSKGDSCVNIRKAIEMGDFVVHHRGIPFIPHLTHFWNLISPKTYGFWMDYDLQWLPLCNALYRISGESPGADKEVKRAQELGIKIFNSSTELGNWLDEEWELWHERIRTGKVSPSLVEETTGLILPN